MLLMDYIQEDHLDEVFCEWCVKSIYICMDCYDELEKDRWFCSQECKRDHYEEYRELHYEDDSFTLVTPETPKAYIRFLTVLSMNGSMGTVALFMSEEDYFQSLQDGAFSDFFSNVIIEGMKAMNSLRDYVPENGYSRIFYVEYDELRQKLIFTTNGTEPDPGVIRIFKGDKVS